MNKIPCEVNFRIENRALTGAQEGSTVFNVEPENLKIGPHENRYVRVKFQPDIMT